MTTKLSDAAKLEAKSMTCLQPGPMEVWTVPRSGKPRCNRTIGHAPPHRRYTRAAEVLAEWTDEEIPK